MGCCFKINDNNQNKTSMIFALIYLFVVSCSAERIITPKLGQALERIQLTYYDVYVNQNLTLTYDAYPGAYDFDLYKLSASGHKTKMPSERDLHSHPGAADIGCHTVDRQLDVLKYKEFANLEGPYNYTLDTSIFNVDQDPEYQDIALIPNLKKLIIIRDDYLLIEADFTPTINLEHSQLKPHRYFELKQYFVNEHDIFQAVQDVQVVCTEFHFCYIFGDDKVIYYDVTSEKPEFHQLNFDSRYIRMLKYSKQHRIIFVAQDTLGVGIFSLSDDGTPEEILNLKAADFLLESIEIRDVNIDEEGQHLYALDFETGLHFFDMRSSVQYEKKPYFIDLHRSKVFNFYKQTFFIVASTSNFMDYALEVFIDFQTGNYYFNKRYQQDMQIFDIDVHEHWAILIGYDAHRVVYHSVYNKFIQDKEEEVYFLDYDLIKVETFDRTIGDDDSRHVLFGLSNDDVRLFHVVTTLPKIICRNNKPQEQRYFLQFNSTQCVSKRADNDHSQFSQCQVDHTFEFATLAVIVDEEHKPVVTGIIAAVSVLLLFVLFVCVYIVCKIKKEKEQVEERFRTLNDERGTDGVVVDSEQ